MSEILHLIGRAPLRDPHEWNRPLVVLHTGGEGGLKLTFADGSSPHDNGGTFPVAELRHRPTVSEAILKQTESEWLKCFIDRWGRGEEIDEQEVLARYAEIHGRPAEQATRFAEFPSVIRERDWASSNPTLERCLREIIECSKVLFVPGQNAEAMSEAKLIRSHIEDHYLQGKPGMAVLSTVAKRHEQILKWILSASAAAHREGLDSPEARLAAIRAPHVKAWTKESFDYLFPG